MKKEYEKKKKLVIFILAAVAVCLAGALCFYLIKIGTSKEPEGKSVQQTMEQTDVTVPEIDVPKDTDTLDETNAEKTQSSVKTTEQTGTADIHAGEEQDGGDEGKPQTKEDAQPPADQPEIKDTDAEKNPEQPPQYEPEVTESEQKPEEPAGGSTNESGQIYVPGFGYMDAPDAPVSYPADSDGDWNKQIGDMN